jgi:NRAMP (natural resistance-associated macrophage protein)-like metal ion transporter
MKLNRLLKRIGPGFITGAADDDPSGIATYSQTGAQFGYGQLWTALFSFPFMAVVQEMCGRIGLVAREGLSATIRAHYARPVLAAAILLLTVANILNIGADLGAMAAAAQLVFGLPAALWLVGLTALTLLLEIFISYPRYAKFLKYLTLSLFAYVATAFVVKQDWSEIALSTFIPSFVWSKTYVMNVVAILGTTISPYLFFWQADEEVEEEIAAHRKRVTRKDIFGMRLDTVAGMFFSNLVMFFIIMTVASTLHANGVTTIDTAAQAAEALRPIAGDFAFLLFALGIVGTGMLAVPILAGSASYAVAEAVGWNGGLYRKFREARGFYGVIIAATLVGLLFNFLDIPPFKLLYQTAVLNGLAAPPLLVMILLVANNKKIMGSHANGWFSNLAGWTIAAIMAAAGIALIAWS